MAGPGLPALGSLALAPRLWPEPWLLVGSCRINPPWQQPRPQHPRLPGSPPGLANLHSHPAPALPVSPGEWRPRYSPREVRPRSMAIQTHVSPLAIRSSRAQVAGYARPSGERRDGPHPRPRVGPQCTTPATNVRPYFTAPTRKPGRTPGSGLLLKPCSLRHRQVLSLPFPPQSIHPPGSARTITRKHTPLTKIEGMYSREPF